MPSDNMKMLDKEFRGGARHMSAIDFFAYIYPEWRKQANQLDSVDECVVHGGETIVCPHDVAHVVLHLNDTLACSEQLITSTNLKLSMEHMIGLLWHKRNSDGLQRLGSVALIAAFRCLSLSDLETVEGQAAGLTVSFQDLCASQKAIALWSSLDELCAEEDGLLCKGKAMYHRLWEAVGGRTHSEM
eukprot:gnl/TRDRNA2_/TRDRNA2_113269_c0_seq1.p1 gnl/TRDRNA2_/TRDRNA2_113269_c0~~gnl/TRDRNA2_/TRDRNA2_113269_c0_seq1.p1  ORF type:complete len:201 (-),score=27.06 gnl/TRDRNA2_/TRDRNA2_113269_c0_seq1:364-924(-)